MLLVGRHDGKHMIIGFNDSFVNEHVGRDSAVGDRNVFSALVGVEVSNGGS